MFWSLFSPLRCQGPRPTFPLDLNAPFLASAVISDHADPQWVTPVSHTCPPSLVKSTAVLTTKRRVFLSRTRAGRPLDGWNLSTPKALLFLMLSFYSFPNAFHHGFTFRLGIIFNTGIPCARKKTRTYNGREKPLHACHQHGANHAEGDEKSSPPLCHGQFVWNHTMSQDTNIRQGTV